MRARVSVCVWVDVCMVLSMVPRYAREREREKIHRATPLKQINFLWECIFCTLIFLNFNEKFCELSYHI